jgi:hypothetical protein
MLAQYDTVVITTVNSSIVNAPDGDEGDPALACPNGDEGMLD